MFTKDLDITTTFIKNNQEDFVKSSGPKIVIVQENKEGILDPDSEFPILPLEHIFVPKPSDRTYIKLECTLLFDTDPKDIDCLGIDCEFAFLPDIVKSIRSFRNPTARNLEKLFKDGVCKVIGYSVISSEGKTFIFRFKFGVDYRKPYQGKGILRVLAPVVTICPEFTAVVPSSGETLLAKLWSSFSWR